MMVTVLLFTPWAMFLSSNFLIVTTSATALSLLGLSGMCFSSGFYSDTWATMFTLLLYWVLSFSSLGPILRCIPSKLGGVVALLASVLVLVFTVCSPLVFYFGFEASLLPMTLLILGLGTQPERLNGALYIWVYTIGASLPLLVALWLFEPNQLMFPEWSTGCTPWSLGTTTGLLVSISLLAKAPIYGLHLWLPQAHVEASALGSCILAGVLLKLGVMGFIRLSSFLPHTMNLSLSSMSVLGGLLGALGALSQVDLKSFIAYSSVAHMSVCLFGVLSWSNHGSVGALFMSLGHGFISTSMFSLVTTIYSMSGYRSIMFNKGVLNITPEGGMLWATIIILNVSVPPYLSFVSELVVSSTVVGLNGALYIWVMGVLIGSLALSLILFSASMHGETMSLHPLSSMQVKDLSLGLCTIGTLSVSVALLLNYSI